MKKSCTKNSPLSGAATSGSEIKGEILMSIQVINVEAMQKFSVDEVKPIMLHQSEGLVTLLLCLEAGQAVGPCTMTNRVQYLVLAGQGQLNVAGEQEQLLNANSLVVVPAGIVRTLLAKERSRVLAIQVP
jgi:quercetin dioxygenase-like cupin family protein